MLSGSKAFSSFAVSDSAVAKEFYGNVLGVEVNEDWMGLQLHVGGVTPVFVYQKDDYVPATYTVLNFPVEDIDAAVDELTKKGIVFERYDMLPATQDEKGVLRGKASEQGPDIAWLKDPSGNILSILSN